MLNVIRQYLSRKRRAIRFYWESFLDARRYLQAAKMVSGRGQHEREHIESDIIRRYHVLEKGLTMPNFRPRYGAEMARQLGLLLNQWEGITAGQNRSPNNQIEAAHAVLDAYAQCHKKMGIDVSDILFGYEPKVFKTESCDKGGTIPALSVEPAEAKAFRRVVETRTSVRDFQSDRTPERSLIKRAIALAVRSPSVCNRQTWRVHAFEGERGQEVLALQNGNRGFGHTIPVVLVVTSDMRYFTGVIERYQAWIDGGMFAMTLLLALHAEGLGAIALNWSVLNERDRKMRRVAAIPKHERIIMVIGCGYPRPDSLATVSQRRPAKDFIQWNDSSAQD